MVQFFSSRGAVRSAVTIAAAITNIATVAAITVDSTVLIVAGNSADVAATSPGLDGYGIPWTSVLIPQAGGPLPTLNSSLTQGNFGSLIVIGSVSYDYNGTYKSALTDAQWNSLYAYQAAFKVRMVRINEYPGPNFGATVADTTNPGCCDGNVDQQLTLGSNTLFASANIKSNAPVSMLGLYHYPATITNTNTTTAFANFQAADRFTSQTVAAVINNVDGRQQLAWFTSLDSQWSLTSIYIQHAYISWMTRGVFAGKRKLHLSPQVDDLQISTTLYYPNNTDFQIGTADLDAHVAWQKDINTRLPAGSSLRLEFGHNGNGNLISATALDAAQGVCNPDNSVDYTQPPDPPLEFQKPLGTGTDLWPASYVTYNWSTQCSELDSFGNWFRNPTNLNAFAHLSHTFTHEELDNSTYHDAVREIQFNIASMSQMGISKATLFSNGLIPPAITGLHNGDVLRAWAENGIKFVVGDNTRPVLRNSQNKYWPLQTNVAVNGYDGIWITPRYSTTVYYNCDKTDCLLQEWYVLTKRTSGTFQDLLNDARQTNVQYLMSLQADPYMFHQANLRTSGQPTITVGNKTGSLSLIMSWIETITQELVRLTNWPIVSVKHDDLGQYFLDRMTLDACKPKVTYIYSSDGNSISGVTVTTGSGNTCSVPVPISIPSGSATASSGSPTVDQVGSEPPIIWITLSGQPVTLTLASPVTL